MAYTSVVANNQDEVLFDASGSARVITLNRPKALNALNLNMVERLLASMKVSSSKLSAVVVCDQFSYYHCLLLGLGPAWV